VTSLTAAAIDESSVTSLTAAATIMFTVLILQAIFVGWQQMSPL
jgi:hypothetical protein